MVNVVVNFLSVVNLYFFFVSTLLTYITIPKTTEKQKLPEIKK